MMSLLFSSFCLTFSRIGYRSVAENQDNRAPRITDYGRAPTWTACFYTRIVRIDEGTMYRASNVPGPIGKTSTLGVGSYVDSSQIPMSGGIPYAAGQSSIVRIPIPGTEGLAIELNPRGRIPRGDRLPFYFSR
jgi:hypothetical protein